MIPLLKNRNDMDMIAVKRMMLLQFLRQVNSFKKFDPGIMEAVSLYRYLIITAAPSTLELAVINDVSHAYSPFRFNLEAAAGLEPGPPPVCSRKYSPLSLRPYRCGCYNVLDNFISPLLAGFFLPTLNGVTSSQQSIFLQQLSNHPSD